MFVTTLYNSEQLVIALRQKIILGNFYKPIDKYRIMVYNIRVARSY